MKAPRGCSPSDGGTLQRQFIPMDLDVYWCDGSVRERWKQDVPSTITRSISGLDSQNRSRAKDLVISIINNQHPLKRRTTKGQLERMQLQLGRVLGTDGREEQAGLVSSCLGVLYFGDPKQHPPVDHVFAQHWFVRKGVIAGTCSRRVRRMYPLGHRDLGIKHFCDLGRLVVHHLESDPSVHSRREPKGPNPHRRER